MSKTIDVKTLTPQVSTLTVEAVFHADRPFAYPAYDTVTKIDDVSYRVLESDVHDLGDSFHMLRMVLAPIDTILMHGIVR